MNTGVDSYGEVAAGLAVRERAACQGGWDKRPGTIEATTGLPALLVAARRGIDGWRVWVSATEQGPHRLTAAKARRLAGELQIYADLCDQADRNVNGGIGPDIVELFA